MNKLFSISISVLTLCALLAGLLPGTAGVSHAADSRTFPETGHIVQGTSRCTPLLFNTLRCRLRKAHGKAKDPRARPGLLRLSTSLIQMWNVEC
jgi:hypothetical protein